MKNKPVPCNLCNTDDVLSLLIRPPAPTSDEITMKNARRWLMQNGIYLMSVPREAELRIPYLEGLMIKVLFQNGLCRVTVRFFPCEKRTGEDASLLVKRINRRIRSGRFALCQETDEPFFSRSVFYGASPMSGEYSGVFILRAINEARRCRTLLKYTSAPKQTTKEVYP